MNAKLKTFGRWLRASAVLLAIGVFGVFAAMWMPGLVALYIALLSGYVLFTMHDQS